MFEKISKIGGKRIGSGRKPIHGKVVKVTLPYDVIDRINDKYEGNNLSDKVRNEVISSLNNENNRKYKVLDLFSGAGGLSLGFLLAGFTIFGAVDNNQAAMETHCKNFSNEFNYVGNIEDVTDETIKSFPQIDIVIGGPPCQGFSSANRYTHEDEDPRNKLFYEFIRFVRIIKPKVFVIENVQEILTKDNGYAKNRIIEITENFGYSVDVSVLNASDYGVPQSRKRAFFVGIRNDIGRRFDFTMLRKTENIVTVEDALEDILYSDRSDFEGNDFLKYVKNSSTLNNHDKTNHSEIVIERIKHVPQGGNWRDVPEDLWESNRTNRHSSAYKRLSLDVPSITIDTGHMNYFHPIENRVPTVRESARIQSFPDSFLFMGTKTQQYTQVGNAVPPLLSKAIANRIGGILNEEV